MNFPAKPMISPDVGETANINPSPYGFDHRAIFRHSQRVRLRPDLGTGCKYRLTLPLLDCVHPLSPHGVAKESLDRSSSGWAQTCRLVSHANSNPCRCRWSGFVSAWL